MSDTQLIHVRVSKKILKDLDRIDAGRSRAEKVSEALEDYLRKRHLLDAIRSGAETLAADEKEVWHSDTAVDAWVRERRSEYERDEG